jgi:hypothetical protein
MALRIRMRWVLAVSLALACAVSFWVSRRWQVKPLLHVLSPPPPVRFAPDGKSVVRYRGSVFITRIATFRDELFAYLMYQHYRSSAPFKKEKLLLTYRKHQNVPEYQIVLVLSDDIIGSVERVAQLKAARLIESFDWKLVPEGTITYYESQTRLFVSAYNLPVKRKMEELSKEELRSLVRRFIRFKSTTDPRVRSRIEPVPNVLSRGDAERLAGDIIAVSEFYGLPLEFVLGVGAMENNYMNVRGDLKHSIWKRRPAADDIILERRKGRVRVVNDSAGLWQITRETLRYVHQLYLNDKRNYGRLPERLRPPPELKVNEVDPGVLTTFAGLLLRDLLDRFNGDVSLAVAAYNGGPGNPNMRYEEGVRTVATHVRSVLERAAMLNGESVMQRSWIRPH